MLVIPRSIPIRSGIALLGFLISAASVSAQQPVSPAPSTGSRVRITVQGQRPVVGSLLSTTSNSISYVTPARDTAAVPLSTVHTFEVSSGVHGHAMSGLRKGLLIGAGLGAVSSAATYEPCDPGAWCLFTPASRGGAAALGGITGGIFGGVVGVVVGALYRSEQWHRVPLEQIARVGVVPSSHGVTAQLSLSLP